MGRNTYEIMAGFWPDSDHPSATAEEIAKLRAEPGKDLVAAGGTEFMHSLIRLGVVDGYRLWVLPAVTGRAPPLFPELDQPTKLRLVKSTAFPSGILELV